MISIPMFQHRVPSSTSCTLSSIERVALGSAPKKPVNTIALCRVVMPVPSPDKTMNSHAIAVTNGERWLLWFTQWTLNGTRGSVKSRLTTAFSGP